MDQVSEFLHNGHECLRMARRQSNEAIRDQFTELARQWSQLAAARQEFIRTLEKANRN